MPMLREHVGVGPIRGIGIRVVEEPQVILRCENGPNQVIELGWGDLAMVNEEL